MLLLSQVPRFVCELKFVLEFLQNVVTPSIGKTSKGACTTIFNFVNAKSHLEEPGIVYVISDCPSDLAVS